MIGLPSISDRTISTGLVITRYDGADQQFLLAVAPKDYWQQTPAGTAAAVFGIGGRLEPGESLVDCVIREASEEGDLTIAVEDSCTTACIQATTRQVTWLDVPDQCAPRPCLVWLDDIDQGSDVVPYLGVVFRAVLTSEPRPTDDVPYLVWFPHKLLPAAGTSDTVTVQEVLQYGGEFIGKPPSDLTLSLVGTARWLKHWLDCQNSIS